MSLREAKPKIDTDASFTEFWSVYPKQVAIEKARKAFAAVIRKYSITPDALIEGARRYAAAQAGQEARWIKHPANWLADGDWRTPSPRAEGAPVIGESGNVVAFRQQGQHQRSWAEKAEERMRQFFESGGRL